MPTQQGQTNVRSTTRTNEPDMYDVVMINDDFTTMQFVVKVLMQVFFHPEEEATRMMMSIHKQGKCVVGTYTYDIAHSKSKKATRMAREEGFPLRLKVVISGQ